MAGKSLSADRQRRSEEHTSELQSLRHLVCRLLLEKKDSWWDSAPTTSCGCLSSSFYRVTPDLRNCAIAASTPSRSSPAATSAQAPFPIFFNDPAPTEIYPLSLHAALPISPSAPEPPSPTSAATPPSPATSPSSSRRSEEHTSELQSLRHLVCRLLLEK